jgi:hypothetical protein
MNTLTQLMRAVKVGRWCKRGAFFVAALGLLQVVALLYGSWLQFHQAIPYGAPSDISTLPLLFGAAQIFWAIGSTVFFSLLLYTVGAVVNAFALPAKSDVTYESLDQAEDPAVDEQAVHIEN